MKEICYSRHGYNGDYTYSTVCGQKVKSDAVIIHPVKATCKKCFSTQEFKTDFADTTDKKNTNIKRRIYIESDILHADEFRDAQQTVRNYINSFGLKVVDRVFSDVLDFAWHDLEKTWQAVKDADEIYATSSLMPLSGGSYIGAPVIFNGMCERAIKEGITGKSVFILNHPKYISWHMIDIKLMKQAFSKNDLYMYTDDYDSLEKFDVSKVKK